MADVDVHITDRTVISALNTPGGPVFEWRDKVMHGIVERGFAKSPKNNPANARHRGGAVGTYQASWGSSRAGSNGHRVMLTVWNDAPHAIFVEEGRKGSAKFQVFSWTRWGGQIRYVRAGGPLPHINMEFGGHATGPRKGKHILRNATRYVLAREGIPFG